MASERGLWIICAAAALAVAGLGPSPARAAATLKTLVSFNGADGSEPFAGLIADVAGNLFGTTQFGGANNLGTVFEVTKTASGYASIPTVLVSFDEPDGTRPLAGLIADTAGNLLGTTQLGGATGCCEGFVLGTAFELAKIAGGYASTPTVLARFNDISGCAPAAGLIADAAGNLFGTAQGCGANEYGTAFELAKTASGYASTPTVLVNFDQPTASFPVAGLIADAAGNLFGTTTEGGTNAVGTIFEVAKTGSGYATNATVLVSFNGTDGCAPVAGLIADPAGNLFGTSPGCGANNRGTVFEVARTASGYASAATVLVSFCGQPSCTDGDRPLAGLIADAAGNLFGTTSGGGANGGGTVFEIAKTASGYASTPTVLVSFCGRGQCENPSGPAAGLIADAAGNLFGTTVGGGANGDGRVFEVSGSGFVTGVPFSSLSAKLFIIGGQHPAFVLNAFFGLGAGTTGINPPAQAVSLQVGPYTATIPAGSFRRLAAGRHITVWDFIGKINNVSLALDILSSGNNAYQFGAAAEPVNLTGVRNPIPVSFSIGNNTGSTRVNAIGNKARPMSVNAKPMP